MIQINKNAHEPKPKQEKSNINRVQLKYKQMGGILNSNFKILKLENTLLA